MLRFQLLATNHPMVEEEPTVLFDYTFRTDEAVQAIQYIERQTLQMALAEYEAHFVRVTVIPDNI